MDQWLHSDEKTPIEIIIVFRSKYSNHTVSMERGLLVNKV